jgi:uncharacterized integral membrane protein
MIKLFRILIGLIGLIVIVAFSVSNRQIIEVALAPLPGTIAMPVFAIFLFGFAVGVIVGGIGTWLAGWRKRREGRRARSRAAALENQLNVIREQEKAAAAKAYQAERSRAAAGPPRPMKQLAG